MRMPWIYAAGLDKGSMNSSPLAHRRIFPFLESWRKLSSCFRKPKGCLSKLLCPRKTAKSVIMAIRGDPRKLERLYTILPRIELIRTTIFGLGRWYAKTTWHFWNARCWGFRYRLKGAKKRRFEYEDSNMKIDSSLTGIVTYLYTMGGSTVRLSRHPSSLYLGKA